MMAERGDFTVVHEPFSYLVMYGHADVGGTRVRSGPDLIKVLLDLPGQVFVKETTGARYPEFLATPGFLDGVTHTFLIRDPRETIPSYLKFEPDAPAERIGFELLHEIYTAVAERTGRRPVVVDASDLVRNPEGRQEAPPDAVTTRYLRHHLPYYEALHARRLTAS